MHFSNFGDWNVPALCTLYNQIQSSSFFLYGSNKIRHMRAETLEKHFPLPYRLSVQEGPMRQIAWKFSDPSRGVRHSDGSAKSTI